MATLPTVAARHVGLLVLESDASNATALKQILDSEGWRVRVVPDLTLLHAELKTAEYSLLIANVAQVGVNSTTFHVLRELTTVAYEEGGRIRVLFVVPEMSGGQLVSELEAAHVVIATGTKPAANDEYNGGQRRFERNRKGWTHREHD